MKYYRKRVDSQHGEDEHEVQMGEERETERRKGGGKCEERSAEWIKEN
jgi:hypothetical protein